MAGAFQLDLVQNDTFQTDTGTTALAGLASGSGAASGITSTIAVGGTGVASATGTVYAATISFGTSVHPSLASGTGAAQAAQSSLAVSAGLASASGSALDPAVLAMSGSRRRPTAGRSLTCSRTF